MSFFLGFLGQFIVVGSDPKHYRFCFGMGHFPRERANFLGAHTPKLRIVPICCGHLLIDPVRTHTPLKETGRASFGL
jgi:hypothetical protein